MEQVNKSEATQKETHTRGADTHGDVKTMQTILVSYRITVYVCVLPEVPLGSGTVTSSASLWGEAPTRRDTSSCTGKEKKTGCYF